MAFLVNITTGPCFSIVAFADDQGHCKVRTFFDDRQLVTPGDLAYLDRVMRRMANTGVIHDEQKSKVLEDGINEFKAPDGARVLWFYDKGKLVISSHGFIKKKGKTPREQIEMAKETRKQYLEAKNAGNIRQLGSFEELPPRARQAD